MGTVNIKEIKGLLIPLTACFQAVLTCDLFILNNGMHSNAMKANGIMPALLKTQIQ